MKRVVAVRVFSSATSHSEAELVRLYADFRRGMESVEAYYAQEKAIDRANPMPVELEYREGDAAMLRRIGLLTPAEISARERLEPGELDDLRKRFYADSVQLAALERYPAPVPLRVATIVAAYNKWQHEIKAARNAAGLGDSEEDDHIALWKTADAAEKAIMAIEADTLRGLAVKAAVAFWADGKLDPGEYSCDPCELSIFNDLVRLARSLLPNPPPAAAAAAQVSVAASAA